MKEEKVEKVNEAGATYSTKNQAAAELGRLGGLKGGKARAAKLTAEQRSEIARNAAAARWGKGRLKSLEESMAHTEARYKEALKNLGK